MTGTVLWDFDGTLAQRPGRWSACLAQSLATISADPPITQDDLRPGLRNGFPWHRPNQSHDHLSTPDAWWDALRPLLVSAYLGAGVYPDLAELAAGQVRRAYTDPGTWTIYEDSVSALERVRAAGWDNIIVSNHVPELPDLVESLGLAQHFRAVLTSAEVGWEKPNPEIYRVALDRAGRPDDIRMIGDNPVADVAGAEAAGIIGLLVRSPGTEGAGPSLADALDTFLPDEETR